MQRSFARLWERRRDGICIPCVEEVECFHPCFYRMATAWKRLASQIFPRFRLLHLLFSTRCGLACRQRKSVGEMTRNSVERRFSRSSHAAERIVLVRRALPIQSEALGLKSIPLGLIEYDVLRVR